LVTPLHRGVRRYRFAAVSLIISALLTLVAPVAWDMGSALTTSMTARLSAFALRSLPEINLPDVSLPKVTFHKPELRKLPTPRLAGPNLSLPDVSLRVPAFVLTPVRRLDEMLAGPLVERGARVLVTDFTEDGEAAEGLGPVLALALEAELAAARYFAVVPRERALAALAGRGRDEGFALTTSDAFAIAPVTSAAALVSGRVAGQAGGGYTLSFIVFDPDGQERYRFSAEAPEGELPAALSVAGRNLRRRLGEAAERLDVRAAPALSASLAALHAYAEARAHLYRGRYGPAILAARRATRDDAAFAAAHQVLAGAYALAGRRARARQALEDAWRFRDRLPERERLRLAADRAAFAGRYPEAILAYDRLFGHYRDDVRALKSQAILQGMIGARGGGIGNLRVAYSIDPVDWPPLQRVARFLGYRGRLPEPASLAEPSG
jgi:tetratricopeptide (TPR) repeat protein